MLLKFKNQWILCFIAAIMLMLSACAQSTSSNMNNVQEKQEGASSDNALSTSENSDSDDDKIVVTWWHAMGGELGETVNTLVEQFNDSQDKITVNAVYQGSYDESLSKLRTTLGTDQGPTLMQVYEIGTRFMIDSQAITPMQKFIDEDEFDLSQLEENILGYYTFDGELYSMPFNTSNPILYYNKDMFKEAGLDPENPPSTYEEVAEAAAQLTKPGQYGASFAIYGWFMEQFFANQGAEYVNNGNGRDNLATASLLNEEAGVETMKWWKQMIDDGVALNLGRNTSDTKKAFAAGQVAMILDSTAALRGIVDSTEGKFEVGTGFLPRPADSKDGGVIVGGASLYIMNNRPEAEQKAAWEFIKYLAAPEQQAFWNVNTGYFPITKAAYDQPLIQENMEKFPQFQTAVNQLHQTKLNNATKGAVMGVFPEARQIVERAMEEIINGVNSPEEALSQAADEITEKIVAYNATLN